MSSVACPFQGKKRLKMEFKKLSINLCLFISKVAVEKNKIRTATS